MATKKLVPLDQYIEAQKPAVEAPTVELPKSHTEAKAKRTAPVTKEQSLTHPAVVVAPKQVPYRIIDLIRPQRGRALFSFTQAWLEVSGLIDGKGYDRKEATLLAGSTAINYHMGKGNFEATKEGLKLTVAGQNFFAHRNPAIGSEQTYDPKMVETFKAILTTGIMDGELVKQQQHIVPMK